MMKKSNYLILCCLFFICTVSSSILKAENAENAEEAVSCSSGTWISCNTTLWVSPSNVNNLNASDYSIASCLLSPSSFNGTDHVFLLDVGATPRTLNIDISSLTEDLDMFLFRNCSNVPGDPNFSSCAAASANGNQAPESITLPNASGQYYLVVDGRENGDRSGYQLTVSCSGGGDPPPPPPPYGGGSCTASRTLDCGDQVYIPLSGNNSLDEDNYDFSGCSHANYSYGGTDHVFDIDVGYIPRNLTITMTGLSADMDMFLFKTCNSGGGSAYFTNCVGYSDNSGSQSETITVYGATGSYKLVVDGFTYGVNSAFTIQVECGSSSSSNCYSAESLYCGESRWVSASYHNNFDHHAYDFSDCYGGGYGYGYTGNDHLYKIDAGSGYNNTLTINLTGLSADLDMFLFKTCGNHYGAQLSDCVAISTNGGAQSEQIVVENAHGTYYLSVDGADPWYSSGYEISVECHTATPDICHYAQPLYCGDIKWVNAPTQNHHDRWNYDYSGCLNYNYDYNGKDHLYIIDAGNSYKEMTIKMSGLSADLDLLLFRYCEDHYGVSTLSHCVDYSIRSGHSYEEIVIHDAYGTYYLAVDSDDPWYTSGYEISLDCNSYTPDICQYATPLNCGDNKWVDAPTYNNLDNRHYNYSGCWSYNYGFTGNDHLYTISAGTYAKDITIKLSNLSADLDMLLYRSCGNHYGQYGLTECLDYSIRSGHSSEEIVIHGATGTYYLAIDANDPWDRSGYEISMTCHEQNNFTCHDAIPIACGESKWAAAPTVNHLSGNDYLFSDCLGYGNDYVGYDHVYKIDLGYHEQHLKVELSNLTSDLDLMIFKSCSPSYSNARLGNCQGFSSKSGYASEKVELEHASGVYYIVVDSKSPWDLSGYKIKVHCTEYPPSGGDDEPGDDEPGDDEPGDDQPPVNPVTLTCGAVFHGTTVDGTSNFDNDDISECFSTNLVYTGPDELIPFVKENDQDVVELILTQDDANLSLFILDKDLNFVDMSCKGSNYSSNKLIENDNVVGEVYTDEGLLPAGDYFALVEGYNRTIESDFSLSMACGDPCASDIVIICETAILAAATSDSSNTRNIYTNSGSALVGYTGGEWIATLSLDSATDVTIDVYNINSEGDLDLFLLDSCDASMVISSSTNLDDTGEQISASLQAGSYTIIVDGWHGAQGTFDIEVTGCADDTNAAVNAESRSGISARDKEIANAIDLQVMPNPFSEFTELVIQSKQADIGRLQLYSIDGQLLFNKEVPINRGSTRIRLDNQMLPDMQGLIIYRLTVSDQMKQGNMIRVR